MDEWITASANRCDREEYRGLPSAFAPPDARSLASARTRAWSRSALVLVRAGQGHACSAPGAIPEATAPPTAGCAQATVEGPGDARREPRRGAADSGLDPSIDGFCPHIAGCLQPRSHPASPINAPQRVRCLRNTNAHLLHPSTEPAQREPNEPDHHRAHNLRHTNIGRHDIDLQGPAGGIKTSAPCGLLAVWQLVECGPILLWGRIHRLTAMDGATWTRSTITTSTISGRSSAKVA